MLTWVAKFLQFIKITVFENKPSLMEACKRRYIIFAPRQNVVKSDKHSWKHSSCKKFF